MPQAIQAFTMSIITHVTMAYILSQSTCSAEPEFEFLNCPLLILCMHTGLHYSKRSHYLIYLDMQLSRLLFKLYINL